MIARLPRLDGVEHEPECPDQARPLRFLGSSSARVGRSAELDESLARFSCSSCSLDVELVARVDAINRSRRAAAAVRSEPLKNPAFERSS